MLQLGLFLLDIFLFFCKTRFELDLGFKSNDAARFLVLLLPEHTDDTVEVAELVVLTEEHAAHGAAIRLLLVVDQLVALAVVVGGEGALAAVAGERSLPCVHSLVLVVVAAAQETLSADKAGERPITIVELHMSGQLRQRSKRVAAHAAHILTQPSEHLRRHQRGVHSGFQSPF